MKYRRCLHRHRVIVWNDLIPAVSFLTSFFLAAPLTLASIVLSYINFAYTTWKLKTLDHRVQQLPMQGDSVFGTVLWFSWFNCQWVRFYKSLSDILPIRWCIV